jgi:dTDP-4-dehydrorhamnose 3,5-epimerase-like enzyme
MPTWIKLQRIADCRGGLVIAEAQKNVPFNIKRVYCLYDLNDEPRGFHAHKQLQQVMVCLSGSCEVLLDDGRNREIVKLNKTVDGLFITDMCWREMRNYSRDCILMVLASDYYNEADYIRDYDQFAQAIKGGKNS